MGDWLLQNDGRERLPLYSPRALDYFAGAYLDERHRPFLRPAQSVSELSQHELDGILETLDQRPAQKFSADLGVSCEACHNGLKYHVENPRIPPRFFRPALISS